MRKGDHDGNCQYALQPDGHQLRCIKSDNCRPLWLMIPETREHTLQGLYKRGQLERGRGHDAVQMDGHNDDE
jgi:hypothetical protein